MPTQAANEIAFFVNGKKVGCPTRVSSLVCHIDMHVHVNIVCYMITECKCMRLVFILLFSGYYAQCPTGDDFVVLFEE